MYLQDFYGAVSFLEPGTDRVQSLFTAEDVRQLARCRVERTVTKVRTPHDAALTTPPPPSAESRQHSVPLVPSSFAESTETYDGADVTPFT